MNRHHDHCIVNARTILQAVEGVTVKIINSINHNYKRLAAPRIIASELFDNAQLLINKRRDVLNSNIQLIKLICGGGKRLVYIASLDLVKSIALEMNVEDTAASIFATHNLSPSCVRKRHGCPHAAKLIQRFITSTDVPVPGLAAKAVNVPRSRPPFILASKDGQPVGMKICSPLKNPFRFDMSLCRPLLDLDHIVGGGETACLRTEGECVADGHRLVE